MLKREDFRPLYWTMLGMGLVAVLILGFGFATLVGLHPFGQPSGFRAHVDGIFPYDASSRHVDGPPADHFRRDQSFAAQVDWSALPPDMLVGATWYDGLDAQVGFVGPEPAGELASDAALVPVTMPPERHTNLPGSYTLKVVRYSGAQPVEVLDTERVVVLHDP